MYELYISPNQCRELLPLIRPFLVLKHRQADLLLEALEIIRSNVHLTGGSGEVRERNRRLLEENFAKLENIHQNLTTLNMRGTDSLARQERRRFLPMPERRGARAAF